MLLSPALEIIIIIAVALICLVAVAGEFTHFNTQIPVFIICLLGKETLKDAVTAIRSCGMLGHVMKILIKINKSKCVLEVH